MKKKVFSLSLVLIIVLVVFVVQGVCRDNCVTSKCHNNMGKGKYVHGPIGAGECTICHVPTKNFKAGKRCDFKFAAKGGELCFLCHEETREKMKEKYVHGPVAMGDCISCHDSHQSETKFQLTQATTAKLCFSCHENKMMVEKFLHGPLGAGDCNVCHDAHSAPYKFILFEEGPKLCFLCHEDRMAEFTRKHIHEPVANSCVDCHDPHNSPFKYVLKLQEQDLCYSCHQDMEKHIKNSTVQHTALEDDMCVNCHTPHSSDYIRQLKSDTRDICYDCHKDMGSKVKSSKYVHGPVKQDDCYACHDSHGSNYVNILKKYFPKEFYIPYKAEYYDSCWDCHNRDIAADEHTTTLTNFRNGSRNLHYVHTNLKKGRSCKACHEMHAGPQPRHIIPEVPFGKSGWMLPIEFTVTKTGGRCVVACHRPFDYDRKNPVKY